MKKMELSYPDQRQVKQSILQQKYSDVLIDGNTTMPDYYKQFGMYADIVSIIEPNNFQDKQRKDLDAIAMVRGMRLQLTERVGLDEVALVPQMVIGGK